MSNYVAPVVGATGPSGPRASFFARLGAVLVDGVLLAVVGFIVRAAGVLASLMLAAAGIAVKAAKK